MPKEMERALRKQADKHNWSEEHKDSYVYGTMQKLGYNNKGRKK